MNKDQLETLKKARWKGRNDLYWLAKEILGYKDVDWDVHYPTFQSVQQFPLPPEELKKEYDRYDPNLGWSYTPYTPLLQLPGTRRRLLLDFRGSFKTTLNVVAHCVQWILNYPDIAILIVHAKQEVAEDILSEVRAHFTSNRVMRDIYPEYCPSEKKNQGNRGRFTVPNRVNKKRKEPTVAIASIDTAVAGYHYDIIKFTDIVDLTNSATADQCRKVIYAFGMYRNVLVAPDYWIDVEGTCYDYQDLYNRIIEDEQRKDPADRRWRITVRGCYKKDTGGMPYTFTPEERDLPDLKDASGNPVSWFPKRFPVHELESMRKDEVLGGYLFASQQLNNPVSSSETPFPKERFRTKTREEMRKVPIAFYTTTVDTGETINPDSDFTVVLTCGWDANGRCYVVDMRRGRWQPDRIISEIFSVYVKYRPVSIRVEETGFVRGMKQSIRRQEDLIGMYLPFTFLPRDNQQAKQQRILMTLQPWYAKGEIFFSEEIDTLYVLQELTKFPKYKDDVLDALADQFNSREWLGRNVMRGAGGAINSTYSSVGDEQDFSNHVKKVIFRAQEALLEGESEAEVYLGTS